MLALSALMNQTMNEDILPMEKEWHSQCSITRLLYQSVNPLDILFVAVNFTE